MAESSSTGNSGTGNGNGGTGNGGTGNGNGGAGTTSTSTSNGGAAAPGSQSSSNGSFSTGNGGNGNGGSNGGVGPGLSFDAGVGAVNGPSIGLPSFNNGKSDFTGFASSNFGQGWGPSSYTISQGADGKHTIHPDANGKHTIYATTESDRSGSTVRQLAVPFMTVDDVYGKGNQSISENQGDYEASSNEKSNVETSTFGKQDEISVTPLSVTKDEGLVNNDAIQSVEGLNFQQKDKANQEVMEAKKSRDEAEAEDNANGMRNQLKAVAEKDAEETETDAFQVGESEAEKAFKEEDAVKQNNLNQLKQKLDDVNKAFEEAKGAKLEADKKAEEAEQNYQEALSKKDQVDQLTKSLISQAEELNANPVTNLLAKTGVGSFKNLKENMAGLAKTYGIEIGDISKANVSEFKAITNKVADGVMAVMDQGLKTAENELANAQKQQKDLEASQNALMGKAKELESKYNKEQKTYATWKTEAWSKVENANVVGGDVAAAKTKADKAVQAYKDLRAQADDRLAEFNAADNNLAEATAALRDANKDSINRTDVDSNDLAFGDPVQLLIGSEISNITYTGKDPAIKAAFEARAEAIQNLVQADRVYAAKKSEYFSYVDDVNNAKAQADKATEEYNSISASVPTTEAPSHKASAEAASYKANIEAARNEINNSKDLSPEQKAEADTVLGNVESAADAMNEAANEYAANPNDINTVQRYVEETARYNKALEDAKGNKTLKNTDFNKTFTKAVAAANDFTVTREDGTQQTYAEFAAEMATKSPELAKGLYEAKAKNYEENGHKVLAAIENAKSKMVMTWLGSKFTFADNQVRSQFNQMAKTDMRATYATYNNVLNDPNATPEQKAEASAAINQANSLMTASAALQASTGFLSGIGDGTSDGVYGTTDPGSLNGYQKALNVASNYAKIALGLGVTPGANEAYQNMYYMAGAKVNESGLFSKDFDSDGFALCQEYGNNAAVGMIAGAGELATAVALMFNPATSKMGINLAIDSVQTFLDGLYGVQKEVNKSIKYSSEVLSYFNEAKSIAAETGNKEAIGTIDGAIKQIEDFQLKSDEVGNLDNWLEGSGSNTTDNGKFNQALSYDEWLKLIEADPVMREYAKSLNR